MSAERSAGVVLPLFSLRGAEDWGIGDFGLLAELMPWLARTGHSRVQLLPLGEMPSGERSPYSALSAFALDPLYVSLPALEDFAVLRTSRAGEDVTRRGVRARACATIDYVGTRAAKVTALRMAFRRFEAVEVVNRTARAEAFEAFRRSAAAWLEPYVSFRAYRQVRGERPWRDWEPALRDASAAARIAADAATVRERHFWAYVQWVANEQLAAAHAVAHRHGIAIDGDLPFVVATDSADVWAAQALFDLEGSLGAPPDAFNADGQDWALPPYRWDALRVGDYAWLRQRIRRTRECFDGCRIDHVVGLFRMWVRTAPGEAGFVPADPDAQRANGEAVLAALRDAAPDLFLMAEDLGDVPGFVREALAARELPGYRVMRWEWQGGVPIDPRAYPACSVATTGTHDTSSLAAWWERELDDAGRSALCQAIGAPATSPTLDTATHTALLEWIYQGASQHVLVPFPDLYAGRERINLPGTVGVENWGYRLPWTVEALRGPEGVALADTLRALCARTGRDRRG